MEIIMFFEMEIIFCVRAGRVTSTLKVISSSSGKNLRSFRSLARSKKRFKVESLKCPAILSEPLALLNVIQLQRLEWSVASRLPTRQKAPLRQKLHPPPILNEPLALLNVIQFRWLALRI
ncbi:hypothetical protein COA08_21500 [Bacillus cereus]|uniref:Uncharacterized protein n=1 Tax=Bacillus cereus TaxID=1396 RepID=A0A2A8U9I7_BACCE|nr:hypothetical protein CON06_17360 [Bacillus cereus]PFA16104.1 hypothetical protein CN382_06485 [Bacillus cereus]PGL62257.1 hypothetical protein CN927_09900 [Bacillus cereus]PGQ06720.1 hypothetical protein COA08_21500 [Bacillus cereus]